MHLLRIKSNFREIPQVSCIFKKDKREEVEKKLPSEEIIKYYCCQRQCSLISRPFHYLTKKKKKDLQIAILQEDSQFSCISKKDEREEVENKLPNEYQPLCIPKGL